MASKFEKRTSGGEENLIKKTVEFLSALKTNGAISHIGLLEYTDEYQYRCADIIVRFTGNLRGPEILPLQDAFVEFAYSVRPDYFCYLKFFPKSFGTTTEDLERNLKAHAEKEGKMFKGLYPFPPLIPLA